MPALHRKTKVLDGRADLLSYQREPNKFYLRVWDGTRYKNAVVPGNSFEEAVVACLDVYIRISSNTPPPPKRGAQPGTKQKSTTIESQVAAFIESEQDRVDAGLLKHSSFRGKKEVLSGPFLRYCKKKGLVKTTDIVVGCFDDYPKFRSRLSVLTKRKDLSVIKLFITFLTRHKLMLPAEAIHPQLLPKVTITDEDRDSNPPLRNEHEWLIILKHLDVWVKEGVDHPNPNTLHSRRKFWCFLNLLKESGLRPGEALQLTWRDIEFEKVDRPGLNVVTHLRVLNTKTKSNREVSCNATFALVKWRQWQKERAAKLGCILTPTTRVFDTPKRNEWSKTNYRIFNMNWNELMGRCRDELAGPQLSPHKYSIYSLRATRAQWLMDSGVDLYLAAKQMGHSPNVLSAIYARMPQRRKATEQAARLISSEIITEHLIDVDDIEI